MKNNYQEIGDFLECLAREGYEIVLSQNNIDEIDKLSIYNFMLLQNSF